MVSLQDFRDAVTELKTHPYAVGVVFIGGLLIGALITRQFLTDQMNAANERRQLAEDNLGTAKKDLESTKKELEEAKREPRSRGDAITAWGADAGTCSAHAIGSALVSYRDKYNVALVCGFSVEGRDRYADEGVTFTPSAAIRNEIIPLVAPWSSLAQKTYHDTVEAISPAPKVGLWQRVTFYEWYQLVLLPKTVDSRNVRNLASVASFGGQILESQIRTRQAHRVITPLSKP